MRNFANIGWNCIWGNTSIVGRVKQQTKKRLLQYIPRNMHTVFALLCFVVVIHWLIFPHPSGLLHWHCGNLKIAPVPAKQPWWIWINTSCEFITNDCITTTKQSTTKSCAYFLGYTVIRLVWNVPPVHYLWLRLNQKSVNTFRGISYTKRLDKLKGTICWQLCIC